MWQFEEEKLGSVGLSVAQLLLGIKMVLFFPLEDALEGGCVSKH